MSIFFKGINKLLIRNAAYNVKRKNVVCQFLLFPEISNFNYFVNCSYKHNEKI